MFTICKVRHPNFNPDDTEGIVIDWFKAEMKGLKLVIGEKAFQRVCNHAASSTDKAKEKAYSGTSLKGLSELRTQYKNFYCHTVKATGHG